MNKENGRRILKDVGGFLLKFGLIAAFLGLLTEAAGLINTKGFIYRRV